VSWELLVTESTRIVISIPGEVETEPILESLRQASILPAGSAWEIDIDRAEPRGALAEEHARLQRALEEQQALMRAMSARLNELEENTRRRLSHELHDRVGQSVTAMSLNLNLVRTRLMAIQQLDMVDRVDRCVRLVDDMAQQVRDVMVELRPPVLDDLGLFAALRWYGAHFAEQTGLLVQVEGAELPVRLPLIVETALFRVTQEALTNVVRHAHARRVTLTLESEPDSARLTIGDDGQGFSPQRPRGLSERPRWGLISMRERAETVGGTMRIASAPGQGTRVILEVAR
jgi:two-component system sensor histidine kinase UhpB